MALTRFNILRLYYVYNRFGRLNRVLRRSFRTVETGPCLKSGQIMSRTCTELCDATK